MKRAEKYAGEYSKKERDEILMARQARKHANFYVPAAPKLAFVMRIRGYSYQLLRIPSVKHSVQNYIISELICLLYLLKYLCEIIVKKPCLRVNVKVKPIK